jgi:hypothetical protein
MTELLARSGFDQQERARVRGALRRYMAEHRIGAPTLQARIIEADAPRHREIPLSTLQRFLTGSHHTHDHHVALCHAFASALPYYGEGRDVAQLGATLAGFLQEPTDGDSRADLIAKLGTQFAGRYETRIKPAAPGGFPYPPESEFVHSHLVFEPVPDQAYLLAREFVNDLANSADGRERRFAFDGVLLFAAPLIYVFLRNSLTRQPKSYALGRVPVSSPGGDVVLFEGEGFDTWFLRDKPAQRLSSHFRVQFIPRAEQGADP